MQIQIWVSTAWRRPLGKILVDSRRRSTLFARYTNKFPYFEKYENLTRFPDETSCTTIANSDGSLFSEIVIDRTIRKINKYLLLIFSTVDRNAWSTVRSVFELKFGLLKHFLLYKDHNFCCSEKTIWDATNCFFLQIKIPLFKIVLTNNWSFLLETWMHSKSEFYVLVTASYLNRFRVNA